MIVVVDFPVTSELVDEVGNAAIDFVSGFADVEKDLGLGQPAFLVDVGFIVGVVEEEILLIDYEAEEFFEFEFAVFVEIRRFHQTAPILICTSISRHL